MERSKLIAARNQRHWTLAEASERIGVDLNTLYRWEKGKTTPHTYNIQHMCKVYGLTVQELGLERTRLQAARYSKHLSIEEVAKRLEVDRATISRWETRGSIPQPYHMRKLCDFYGMTAEQLGFDADSGCAMRTEELPDMPGKTLDAAIKRIDDLLHDLAGYRDELSCILHQHQESQRAAQRYK